MARPMPVNGITVSNRIPADVSSVTCHDAWLCRNGTLGVLIICMTSVWLHMDSTNHPVWNIDANKSFPDASSAAYVPPQICGHMKKYKIRNVVMSNTELVGPIHSMNFSSEEAFQSRGF